MLAGVMMGVAVVVVAVDLANAGDQCPSRTRPVQVGAATHRLEALRVTCRSPCHTALLTTGNVATAPVIQHPCALSKGRRKGFGWLASTRLPGSHTPRHGQHTSGSDRLRTWLTRPGVAVLNTSAADHLGVTIGDALKLRRPIGAGPAGSGDPRRR